MSLSIFYQELEELLSVSQSASSGVNALSIGMRPNLRETNSRFEELMTDASDWSRMNDLLGLSSKLSEISGEDNYGHFDVSQLEAKIRRSMRAFRTFGHYSPEEQYKREIAKENQETTNSLNPVDKATPQDKGSSTSNAPMVSRRVFVVHGHDDSILHQVMRILTQVGLEGVVLREQASEGRAIIEKLEHYSEVGFAVILMTADDMGGSTEQTSLGKSQPRARQNVILELGYFAAKLTRKRICVLKEADVEAPSDILGIVYTEIDRAGAWKLTLGKELKAAGYSIDLNQL